MATAPNSPLIEAGPHVFESEVRIARPVAEVYPLLDFADPRNAKRQLGEKVEAVAGQPETFTMVLSDLPDAVFTMQVTHAEPGREYAYTCVSSVKFGRAIHFHEHFVLEPMRGNKCRLKLRLAVTFEAPLDEDAFAVEAMMLSFSGSSALGKIKLHAEDGVEAVLAVMAHRNAIFADDDETCH